MATLINKQEQLIYRINNDLAFEVVQNAELVTRADLEVVAKKCMFIGTIIEKIKQAETIEQVEQLQKVSQRLIVDEEYFDDMFEKFVNDNELSGWF